MLKRLLSQGGWSFFGALLNNVILILIMIFMSRTMDQGAYAHIIIYQTTLMMISTLVSGCLGLAIIKFCSEYRANSNEEMIFNVIRNVILILILTISFFVLLTLFPSKEISLYVFGNDNSINYSLLVFTVVLVSSDSIVKSVLISYQKIKLLYISSVFSSFVSCGIFLLSHTILGEWVNLYWFVLYYLLQLISSLVCCYLIFEKRSFSIFSCKGVDLKNFKLLIWFCIPSFLSSLIILPCHWFVQYLIKGNDTNLLGVAIFGICLQWFNILSFIPNSVGRVILPMLSNNHNKEDALMFMKMATKVNLVVCIPIFAFIVIFSEAILLTYGEQYLIYRDIFTLSALSSLVMSVQLPVSNVFASQNRMWLGFLSNIIWAMFYIIPSWYFSGQLYIVFLSLLFAYLIHSLFNFYIVKKIL